MSRIGKMPVAIPSGVTVKLDGQTLRVEGPKGKLGFHLPQGVTAAVVKDAVTVQRQNDTASARALHGLCRAILANMVQGVTHGFQKDLEVVGVGYRAQVQGRHLTLTLGYSHPVVLEVPEGLTVETPKPTQIVIKGADKQLVGQFAANVRHVAPPEPYKGKGIKYAGEVIRRKAGKAATGAKTTG